MGDSKKDRTNRSENARDAIHITTRKSWREWLVKNHRSERSVWLVCPTKKSTSPSIDWSELVDEALCFGWIDSTRKSIDATKFRQLFSKRKPRGTWSKINKEKVQRLIAEGLMTEAGLGVIEKAKQNGAWNVLDEVEQLIIPEDLAKSHTSSNKNRPWSPPTNCRKFNPPFSPFTLCRISLNRNFLI